MAAGKIYAVLTGDLVGSSGLESKNGGPPSQVLTATAQQIQSSFQSAVRSPIDVFRGDSWQLVVSQPDMAVRVALLFRTLLRTGCGIDSRVAIAFGEIDFLPPDDISTGTGQAFTLSGQGLEGNLKTNRMTLIIPSLTGTMEGQGLEIITQLIDLQVARWTPGQAQAVAGALMDKTQIEIAADWQPAPVSQQAISQHLESAAWGLVKNALLYLEQVLQELYALDKKL